MRAEEWKEGDNRERSGNQRSVSRSEAAQRSTVSAVHTGDTCTIICCQTTPWR